MFSLKHKNSPGAGDYADIEKRVDAECLAPQETDDGPHELHDNKGQQHIIQYMQDSGRVRVHEVGERLQQDECRTYQQGGGNDEVHDIVGGNQQLP